MLKVKVPCDFCEVEAEVTTKAAHFSVQSNMPKGWRIVYMLPVSEEELHELEPSLLACPKCAKEVGDAINKLMRPRSAVGEVVDIPQ